jgi:ATP-dependent protease HslVU (ClpYQ) peptidase subunit
VVGHEAVGVAYPAIAFGNVLECVQKIETICIVSENRLLLVTPRGYVIDGSGVFDAEGTGHERKIAAERAIVNPQDLTLWIVLTLDR